MDLELRTRSRVSLCQLLLLIEHDHVVLLLGKHNIPTETLEDRRGKLKFSDSNTQCNN
jgi:hypothetical protein